LICSTGSRNIGLNVTESVKQENIGHKGTSRTCRIREINNTDLNIRNLQIQYKIAIF
jgi:hypothetical protein